jgi:DNA mismatch repair ATPase MutL
MCALKLVNKAMFYERVADGQERIDTLVRETLTQAVLTARWAAQHRSSSSSGSSSSSSNGHCNGSSSSNADSTSSNGDSRSERAPSSTAGATAGDSDSSNSSSSNSSSSTSSSKSNSSSTSSKSTGDNCPIVRLTGVFETAEHLVLELELMSGIDLFDKLSRTGVLRDADAATLVRNMLKAVLFCSSQGIVHRDIKLSNCIYNCDASHRDSPGNVRLADFGMAGRIGSDGLLRGRCGTPGNVVDTR